MSARPGHDLVPVLLWNQLHPFPWVPPMSNRLVLHRNHHLPKCHFQNHQTRHLPVLRPNLQHRRHLPPCPHRRHRHRAIDEKMNKMSLEVGESFDWTTTEVPSITCLGHLERSSESKGLTALLAKTRSSCFSFACVAYS